MNAFYKQPVPLQWIEAVSVCIVCLLPALTIIELTYDNLLYSLLFVVYVPVGQFGVTPLFRLLGVYKYYSPMLIGYLPNQEKIDLHSGGSFDYLFLFAFTGNRSIPITKRIMSYHLEGLLALIHLIEDDKISGDVVISGTSYFLSERTIRKIGFETVETPLFYKLNLYINAIDLFWMYSLSQGRLAFPRIWKAKTITISGKDLVRSKENIRKYSGLLGNSLI